MSDDPLNTPPGIHTQLANIERQLEDLQARLCRATELAEHWAKSNQERGLDGTTGNALKLFARDLHNALSPPTLTSSLTDTKDEQDEPASSRGSALGRITGLLAREFPNEEDWTLEAASESLVAVLRYAYGSGECLVYAIQAELEEWFDPQHSDLQQLLFQIMAAAEIDVAPPHTSELLRIRHQALADRLCKQWDMPPQLAYLIGYRMLTVDAQAIASGKSRRAVLFNELDRWVGLPEWMGEDFAAEIYTGCPITAQCLDIARPGKQSQPT